MAKIIIQFENVSHNFIHFLVDDISEAINQSKWKPSDVTIVTENSQEVS